MEYNNYFPIEKMIDNEGEEWHSNRWFLQPFSKKVSEMGIDITEQELDKIMVEMGRSIQNTIYGINSTKRWTDDEIDIGGWLRIVTNQDTDHSHRPVCKFTRNFMRDCKEIQRAIENENENDDCEVKKISEEGEK